jgi:antitoxin component YwqK of YwqJK toxin-antitoxin module
MIKSKSFNIYLIMMGSLSHSKIFATVVFTYTLTVGFSQISGVPTKCDEIVALDSKSFKHIDGSLFIESEFYDSIVHLDGKKYTGKVKICDNGFIRSVFSYTDGLFDGDIFLFSKNGFLLEKSTYKMGHLVFIESYYEDGSLQRKGGYENGIIAGVWLFYYPNMRIKTIEDYTSKITSKWFYFYDNGQLMEVNQYKESKKDGEWSVYYENGQLNSIKTWSDNKKMGKWKYFYRNGQLLRVENYDNDKKNGDWIEYYESGNIKEYRSFKDGIIYGESKEYYENGQLKSVISWSGGEENGTSLYYDENGKIYCSMEYKDGVLTRHKGKCW